MKKLIFVSTFILAISISNAQNITMAKAFYKKAQKEYENKNYREVIKLLDKTVENLNGDTNPDIIYLKAKSKYNLDSNVNESKALFEKFLKEADNVDDRISDVSSILVDIETSDNYYSNGQRKRHEFISPKNGDKIVFYHFSTGFLKKYENYSKERNFNLTSITYFKGETKSDRKTLRKEYYDIDGNLESTDYYLSNGSIRVWGKGKHIQIYDKENNLTQRYGYEIEGDYKFEVDGGFYAFKSFNSWKNDDYITYIKCSSGCLVYETYEKKTLELLEQHKGLFLGPVKLLRTDYYGYEDNDFYLIYFNESGIPTKKEYYKREKLKETFTFNKEDNTWTKE